MPNDTNINNLNIRSHFPILQLSVHGKPLIYLDNAATSQKPMQVIDAIDRFYFTINANVHRGVHTLSELATAAYERARENIRSFINAKHAHEIIITKNTTEAINLVAYSFGQQMLKPDDEIIISTMEHHSNIVPWQIACEHTGAKLRIIAINERGELDLTSYTELLNKRTKLVAINHVSNTLGTINPIKAMIAEAHAANIPVLIDGAQAAGHLPIDVLDLDCDFYAFSGHKMYATLGIGVLYGKTALLDTLPPYQAGGDMIKKVTFSKTEYAALPQKFEAGTQNVGAAVGLSAAIDFINNIGLDKIADHEQELLNYAQTQLKLLPWLQIIGNATQKTGIISFVIDAIHPHDIATILDTDGIAVRAGHHCTMPLMDYLKLPGTTRASFGIYNTKAEIDQLVVSLDKVKNMFS